jgi:hypothetical protein
VVVALHGFVVEAYFDRDKLNPYPWAGPTKRPSELILRNDKREHRLILTWPSGTPEASVTMDEGMTVKSGDIVRLKIGRRKGGFSPP